MHQPTMTESGDSKLLATCSLHFSINFIMHVSCMVCICFFRLDAFMLLVATGTLMVSVLVDQPLSNSPVPSRSFASSIWILSKSGANYVLRSLAHSIFDFLWPPFQTSSQTKMSPYSGMVRLFHLEFSPTSRCLFCC